jgi:HK97 family phage prohead protease
LIKFTAIPITLDAAAGDADAPRTITGIAVPWDVKATVSGGESVLFLRGAFDLNAKAPRLLENHDGRPIGIVTELVDLDEGLGFSASFANTKAADDVVELIQMSAYDSVSVGAVPVKFTIDKTGTMIVSEAKMIELSVVTVPAFSDAVITQIAASEPDPEVETEATEPQPQEIPQEETLSTENNPIEASSPEAVPTQPIYAQAKRALKLPSPGEYIAAMKRGGSEFAQLNANIQAATGDVVISDAAGLLPTQVLAPVFTDINPLRPIVTALGTRAMPQAGSSFLRPFVKVHSAVGQQSTELSGLSTANFEVDDVSIAKKTFGGKLVLSEQVIDWSSPSMLDAAIQDMTGQYALATEKETVDTLVGAMGAGNAITTDLTDGEEIIADLYLAASEIAEVGNYLPNALLVAPKSWAKLGAAVDGQGRPLFPLAGPVNSAGALPQGTSGWNGNILGLTLIVSNQITDQAYGTQDADDFLWVLNTRAIETYEQQKGFLELRDPANLGVTISLRGYFAAAVLDADMVRACGPAIA